MESNDLPPKERVGAVIVAAGRSERMGGVDKLFASLSGQPLLAHVLNVFQNCPRVDEIVLVLGETNLERGKNLLTERSYPKVTDVCLGGARRQDSVLEGLRRLESCSWVLLHDGARPCVTENLIVEGLSAAQETGAAIAAVPATDTIKIVGDSNLIESTPARETLWQAQTPQVFRRDLLLEAYKQVDSDVTDDAALVESLGYRVKVYRGSYDNIKVTSPRDLDIAELILRDQRNL